MSEEEKGRDDFPQSIKELLAKRVALRCCNPGCEKTTSGPQQNPSKAINIGVACHITAASPQGPRFDSGLTSVERSSIENGIWLCQNCAKLIDNDPVRYPIGVLKEWKHRAEQKALQALETTAMAQDHNQKAFVKIQRLMPDLLSEMRNDLSESPFCREFVVLRRGWMFSYPGRSMFTYYFEGPSRA